MISAVFLFATMALAIAPAPVENFIGVMDPNAELMCTRAADEPRTPYGFANAVLNSLTYARDAADRALEIPQVTKQVSDPTALMTELLRISKTSTDDYMCAESALSNFNQNGVDPTERMSAQNMLVALHEHIGLNRDLEALIKRMGNEKPAEVADQMSTMQVRRSEIFHSMLPTVQIALLMLEDDNHPNKDGNIDRLLLSSSQKNELEAKVQSEFPELANQDQMKDNYAAFLASAYLVLLKSHLAADQ